MRKDEEIYQQLIEDDYKVQKYETSGIYAIFAYFPEERRIKEGELAVIGKGEDLTHHIEVEHKPASRKLLYIGKSKNMLKRISAHLAHILYPYCKESYSHKYNILRQIETIEFDVLSYNLLLLDETEGEYIRKYKPPLNTQIPKPEGGYWVNKKARTITLEEILENE